MSDFPDTENDDAKDDTNNILCNNILNDKHMVYLRSYACVCAWLWSISACSAASFCAAFVFFQPGVPGRIR